jgi:hypothetical protein
MDHHSNLVLTAGLRADVPIFEQNFIANTNADALTYRNGVRISTGEVPEVSVLLSPRVGVNWDVNGDKQTQVRGGIGIFAAPLLLFGSATRLVIMELISALL